MSIALRFLLSPVLIASALASGLVTLSAQTPPVRPQQPSGQTAPANPAPATATPNTQQPAPTLERVNTYFNNLKGLQADFLQMSPDGRSFGGTLYLLRPGLMRFEYNPPATLEIVADGRSVAIKDRKLNTQDVYFIGQTPLKFLLQPRIDVAKDSKVVGLRREGEAIVLVLEDRSTLGGTSKIRVVFDGRSHALREWTVTDPQGLDTRVTLSNLNPNALPDRKLFVIEDQKVVNPN